MIMSKGSVDIYSPKVIRSSQGSVFNIKIIANKDAEFLKSLGLEAKFVVNYLDGKFGSYEEFFEELFKEERHFAKRQNTWYGKEQNVVWLDAKDNLVENASKLVSQFLQN